MGESKKSECEPPPALHALRVDRRVPLNRAHAAIYACAVLALLYHRARCLLYSPTFLSFSLLLSLAVSELVLAFMWALTQAYRWRPVHRREFPERLAHAVDPKADFPALDVFVCTADPQKEPPMGVANTVLSVMAFDYPADKLSVYVSDDGGSELTLFALVEAARFARYWLPFCREHDLVDRCPDAYFKSNGGGGHSEKIQMMYQNMKEKVERTMERGWVGNDDISRAEQEAFKKWTVGFTRQEHPTVIQVLSESSKDMDITDCVLPNLVYVSREKRRSLPHNFKAGALNVLVRVSSIMTNGRAVLTLDCDMYSNDPQTPRRALCYMLDRELTPKLAYIQFPQRMKGIDKNDIYGNEHRRLAQIQPPGSDGLRGPTNLGTGCFFSRRAFYGSPCSPLSGTTEANGLSTATNSMMSSEAVLRKAHQAASCTYEHGTEWGLKMGFRYGSIVEDYNTGYHLHCEGWESVFCHPQRPAFLGDAPVALNDVLAQARRWSVGFLEVAFSKHCPLIYGTRRISLLHGMCYAMLSFWGIWCIPITTYAVLPQIALTHQVALFPKASDLWFSLYAYLFLTAYAQDLADFLISGGTIHRWWNDQRMWMIRGVTSHLFGLTEFSLKQIGIANFGFNVTSKVVEDEQSSRYKKGIFDFGVESPFFVSVGTVAVLNLSSFVVGLVRTVGRGSVEEMFVQLFISGFVMVNCWPVYEAMALRSDGGRMPRKVTTISVLLAGVLHTAAYFMFKM